MALLVGRRGFRLRSADRSRRRNAWACAAAVLTLWLAAGGCDGEQIQRANYRIAFTSNRNGNDDIYVMYADGSNQTRFTTNDAHDEFAAWSPDGQKIAFTSDRDDSDEVYMMNADGSNQTRLTPNDADDWEPTFRPQ